MEYLAQYGLFLAKAVTIIAAILLVIGSLVSAGSRMRKAEKKGHLEVEKLNDHYTEMKETLTASLLSHDEYKRHVKASRKAEKEKTKQHRVEPKQEYPASTPEMKKRIFVIDFYGDIRASEVSSLEQLVSAIITVARSQDEVVIRLESSGGMVHSYGLAASQLSRFRSKNIPLTVAVDKVAASGGYMMACVGNRILAAPFAIVGSIGVLAQIPNFHRLLKKHDIDYEMITAGEYKRTLTIFGENTEKGRAKFSEDIQDTHELFKQFVAEFRPSLDVASVATGEIWFGKRALERGLVDVLQTSEEYLLEQSGQFDIYQVRYIEKRSLQEKLGLTIKQSLSHGIDVLMHRDREAGLFH